MPDPAGFPRRRLPRVAVWLVAGLVVAVAAVFLFSAYAARERALTVQRWRSTLDSMADSRRDAIEGWVTERRGDATVIARYPTTQSLVGEQTGGPHPPPVERGAARVLTDLLDTAARTYGYRGAWVVREGTVVTQGTASSALSASDLEVARSVATGAEPLGGFVVRGSGYGILFAAPIVAASGDAVRGMVVLESDPADFLYPLLTDEPFPSESIESALAAREGSDIVFLTPLRHGSGAPLDIRRPADTPALAAADALAGLERFGAYVDYRDEPIFAATRDIRGTPWALVVKVDEVEALADYRREVGSVALALTALALAAAGLAFGFVRAERAKAHLALLQSEARFAGLVDHASDIIFVVGRDGRILDANRRATERYGYDRDELRHMMVQDLRAADRRHEVPAVLADLSRTGEGFVETVHQRKDGTYFAVEISTRYIEQSGGGVFLAVVRDVTERRAREAVLRESEARFRLLAEHAQDLIFRYRLRPNRGFEYVSPSATAITGYTPAEHYADPDLGYKIVHPDDRPLLDRSSAGPAGGGPLTLRWLRRDGTVIWTEMRVVVVRDDGGTPMAVEGIARDVTERMRAQEALAAAQQQLAQSQKLEAIGRLAAGVAHDFNNLLTVITGYADLLERAVAEDAQARGELALVRDAADRAAGLTRQLLAFGRQQVLQPRVVNLNEVVQGVARLLRRVIGEDVRLIVRSASELGNVEVDPAQMEQVLMNLAVNARDAMPRGGTLAIETSKVDVDAGRALQHGPLQPGSYVLLTVSDTGVGMDTATRARIFEPFYTTKTTGSGLGLATVYGIVKQSNGYIWADSEPGHGTTFRIYLPRVDRPVEERRPSRAQPDAADGGERILVVEDQPMLRALVRRVLEGRGYQVILAPTGTEAVGLAESAAPIDLLLTDVVLPDISGPEVAERLLARRPDMRVLFMSGYARDAAEGRGRFATGGNFLPKPFTPDVLLDKVREVLKAVD